MWTNIFKSPKSEDEYHLFAKSILSEMEQDV